MAEEEAKAEEQAPAEKPKKEQSTEELKGLGIFGKIISIIIIVWLVSISYYAFAFFALGMLPSILSSMIDRGTGRFASKTVTACNFVAIVPYLFDIGLAYERDILAKQFMNDINTWVIVYGFAAIGLMLIWILPNTTLIFFTVRADIRRKNLQIEQEGLLAEWGEEVKTGKPRRVNQKG